MSTQKANGSGLTAISIAGYKSLTERVDLEIRPLTVLAGPNSAGKSSLMQALLLIKQTLDVPYDPGGLLLNGPNVRLTSTEQIIPRTAKPGEKTFFVEFSSGKESIALHFVAKQHEGLVSVRTTYTLDHLGELDVHSDMSEAELAVALRKMEGKLLPKESLKDFKLKVVRDRCFLTLHAQSQQKVGGYIFYLLGPERLKLARILGSLIHVPGLRGNPERDYPTTATAESFPGVFQDYVASIISAWGRGKSSNLKLLGNQLKTLGLTWTVKAKTINETKVELRVGRLQKPKQGGSNDLVSIADVGFGVSQVLPVLVALLAAQPGQIVYIEQPEIHLHPRAQLALAQMFIEASNRGVQVVVETHSALFLRGLQTQVAQGAIDPSEIKLHWASRDDHGETQVTSCDMDATGAFGDWPVDFDDVSLQASSDYLDAAEAKLPVFRA